MTIDKAKFEAVLSQLDAVKNSTALLGDKVDSADPDNTFSVDFDVILYKFEAIEDWANQKILEADQETVMNGFLSELKVVFDKYAAKMEVGSDETGYGESYGTSGTTGVKLTATLDGVTSTKEINKAVIVSGDLV